jgi:hypothetical protein
VKLRTFILVGLVCVAAASIAAVAVTKPWDDADLARHRRGPARVLPPQRPTPTPAPTDDTETHQHGSSEGDGSGPVTKTERHEIHGSGSVVVVSGAVDAGTGGSDTQGSYVGPPRRPRPPRR